MNKKRILTIGLIGILLISLIFISTSLNNEEEKDFVNLSKDLKDEKEVIEKKDDDEKEKIIEDKKEEDEVEKELDKENKEEQEKESDKEIEVKEEPKESKDKNKIEKSEVKEKEIVKEKKPTEEKSTKEKEYVDDKKEEPKKSESPKIKEEKKEEPIVEEPVEKKTVSISFDMTTALNNIDRLKEEKRKFIPQSGYLLSLDNIEFNEGDSVFDLTIKVLGENGIQVEYEYSPVFDSYYIEGINNIYEFDFGDDSGWVYEVNRQRVNVGSSSYILKDGDSIVWKYVI